MIPLRLTVDIDSDTALPHPTVVRSSTPAAFANCESYTTDTTARICGWMGIRQG